MCRKVRDRGRGGFFPLIDAILTCIVVAVIVAIIVLTLAPAYYRASMSTSLRELSLTIKHAYLSKTCIRISIYLPCKLHVIDKTWLYCGKILIGHYPNIIMTRGYVPSGRHILLICSSASTIVITPET